VEARQDVIKRMARRKEGRKMDGCNNRWVGYLSTSRMVLVVLKWRMPLAPPPVMAGGHESSIPSYRRVGIFLAIGGHDSWQASDGRD
jgi:hypothetical protein